MGYHLIRVYQLGVPQGARDVFRVLGSSGWIEKDLADRLQHMVGFRNIAVREYQSISLAIVRRIIARDLDDLLVFSQRMLTRTMTP